MKRVPPYNPLEKKNLGASVAAALLRQPAERLPPKEPFIGAGIYVIYYIGDFPEYEELAARNRDERFDMPIYVGKAVPKGARKGGFGLDAPAGSVLYSRLKKHARSVEQASNLNLDDFFCRYLVVDDVWVPLGENLLIDWFQPVWNKVIDGFGSHDPGKGRYGQRRSAWDTLHPGRPWTEKVAEGDVTREEILDRLRAFVAQR